MTSDRMEIDAEMKIHGMHTWIIFIKGMLELGGRRFKGMVKESSLGFYSAKLGYQAIFSSPLEHTSWWCEKL